MLEPANVEQSSLRVPFRVRPVSFVLGARCVHIALDDGPFLVLALQLASERLIHCQDTSTPPSHFARNLTAEVARMAQDLATTKKGPTSD